MTQGVSGSFTGTATGTAVEAGYKYLVRIYGTFVATIVVNCEDPDGTFRIDPDSNSSFTAPVVRRFDAGGSPIQLECTAFTSGTANWSIMPYKDF